MESAGQVRLLLPDGREVELPILVGTAGPPMIDIRQLHAKTGLFTFDPGFTATGSCESKITFIDGEKGALWYRGYRIEDLANKVDFVEVCYLLIYGDLPSLSQKSVFEREIKCEMMIHEQLINFYRGFKSDAHPMAIMTGVVGALSAFMHDDLHVEDPKQREMCAIRLIAKMPTIAAIAYKTSVGQPIVYPRSDLSYTANFLHMMFALPTEPYEVNPVLSRALDSIFLLHADHEQNASSSTVRIAGSSQANPYACVAAGIASLWGPAHGGANEAVLNMLEEIGSKDRIPEFLARAKNKNDTFRLMGFGHRVYKNFDPRAVRMREMCLEVLGELGVQDDPLFALAMELERVALSDEYFVSRKLYPNVDFYSGIVLQALGIPKSMFTVLFAVARSIGWITQWMEMMSESTQKISRPRQLYTGHGERDCVPLDDRSDDHIVQHIGLARGAKSINDLPHMAYRQERGSF
eukprot:GILJ01000801.1.p1 GENE.GILJ01000801.1~~GILJ01000801.1.p1  ORF type:complete len:478 (-),score=68.89 GILJ01000801.1:144-1538(-)